MAEESAEQPSPVTRIATINYSLPKPTLKEVKRWKPIAELCYRLVLTNPADCSGIYTRNRLTINWGTSSPPEDFPPSRRKNGKVLKYAAAKVLDWLYIRRLAKYSTSMIYRARQSILWNTTNMLSEFEIKVDKFE